MTKARKKDGLERVWAGGGVWVITIILQRPRCTIVKDLIHVIQYELNHHLLNPDSEEGCISIATSGFNFFGPKPWKKHIQLSESAPQPGAVSGGQWAFCIRPVSSMYKVCYSVEYFNYLRPIKGTLQRLRSPTHWTNLTQLPGVTHGKTINMILMNRQELIFIFIGSLSTPTVPWGKSSFMKSYEAVDSGHNQLWAHQKKQKCQ